MWADIDKHIARHINRIRKAFRGVINLVNAAGAVQIVSGTGLNGEKVLSIELFQHYGYTSNPPAGTMKVVIPIGGKTSHGIIVATEHPTARPKGFAPGESALYDDQGQMVHITRAGIFIIGAGKPVTITDTPKVRMETDLLEVTGEVKDLCDSDGRTMSGMRDIYNGHVHPENDTGGPTDAPNQGM
jgi:phage baseplate assembly protein V